MESCKQSLSYYTEWGGRSWLKLTQIAIDYLRSNGGFEGLEVLDLGTRYGKMAIYFAKLGAKVTGIDTNEKAIETARANAENEGVQDIDFIHYDGDLNILPDNRFDIVFTKSVLIVVPDLAGFLVNLSKKLRSRGKVVFIENGKGPNIVSLLRRIKHKNKWNWRKANLFSAAELELMERVFSMELVKKSYMPPIYLCIGEKK